MHTNLFAFHEALVKVLAKEVAAFNIRTLTVHLGSFNTNMPNAAVSGTNPAPECYNGSMSSKTIHVMREGTLVARGDASKAAVQLFNVAMGQGVGAGHEGEFCLPLGEEMPARIRLAMDRLDNCLKVYGQVCNDVKLDK